jgi:GntR family transcriptional repressor for pyruvate dehydrogenase complex
MNAAPKLPPARKSSVVEGVLASIKDLLQRGAELPAERVLARSLGVSRPSVREALRTLERMGVIDVRHGSGARVAASGEAVLRSPLEYLIALDRPSIHELHETRVLLETHLAERAAERRSHEDLAALEASLRDMKAKLSDPKAVTDPDLRFHRALAAAARNRLLERVMNCLQESVRDMIDAAWPGNRSMNSSWKRHADILDAVRRADPAAARRAMQRHMDEMTRELRAVGLVPRRAP